MIIDTFFLNRPTDVTQDPVFVNLRNFERSPAFLEIYKSMQSEGNGTASFVSERVIANGNSLKEGVKTVPVKTTYHWMPVRNK